MNFSKHFDKHFKKKMLIGQNKQWKQNNVLYFLKFVTYLLLSRPYIPFLFLSKSVSFI